MYKYLYLITLFGLGSVLLVANTTLAQTRINGVATYNQVSPLAGVNIFIDDSYDGATTDKDGKFSFETSTTGSQKIIARLSGFMDVSQTVDLKAGSSLQLKIVFTLKFETLGEVIVKGKAFTGSDQSKAIVLSTLDILTTASDGNITTALKTLPGAQQVGESGDLFVRGGTGAETKIFIDGLLVNNYNYSSPSNQASRSRFQPGMFKGTFFSSGAYSAQYGQAMSSTLILESEDVPLEGSADLSLSPVFVGGNFVSIAKDKKSSVGAGINYTNLLPYFSVAKPSLNFTQKPEYLDGNFQYKRKIGKTGLLKFFGSTGINRLAFEQPTLDNANQKDLLELKNKNVYSNLTYRQTLKNGWKLYGGTSFSYNADDASLQPISGDLATLRLRKQNNSSLWQARSVLTKSLSYRTKLDLGGEYMMIKETLLSNNSPAGEFTDHLTAVFAETDTYLASNFSARLGARYEYSSQLGKSNVAPRASLGYTLPNNGVVSLGYGTFYQKSEKEFLFTRPTLGFSHAKHYILSYQKLDNYYTFRTEVYYKSYQSLLKTALDTTNSGSGYAKGLEVFWRDKKTLPGVDYWLSYSYLNTKRDYLDYPFAVQPNFAANHTFSLVVKKFFPGLSTNISTSYTYASGRPYYNPNQSSDNFMADRTIDYNNLALNIAYLPKIKIKRTFSVLVLSVSNILGNQQIYNYTYSPLDSHKRQAVRPINNPFVFLGFFMNFGVDRTDAIINSRL